MLGTYLGDTRDIIDSQLEYPKTLNYLNRKKGGFNLLNTPDELYGSLGPDGFWKEVNEPFLKSAIDRGDDIYIYIYIYIATKPTMLNIRNQANSDGLSGFGREYQYLVDRVMCTTRKREKCATKDVENETFVERYGFARGL